MKLLAFTIVILWAPAALGCTWTILDQPQFEYKIIQSNPITDDKQLNAAGREGWDLLRVSDTNVQGITTYFLQRVIKDGLSICLDERPKPEQDAQAESAEEPTQ